jgi:biopolymer transport protein ExbD
MKIFAKKNKNIEFNIAPLIDIVFLLLIFFMLASEFTDFKTIDMATPINSDQDIESSKPLLVKLSSDGKIKIKEVLIDFSILEKKVINLKKNQTDTKVIISTPEKTEINLLMKVMDIIRIGGIDNIALITE